MMKIKILLVALCMGLMLVVASCTEDDAQDLVDCLSGDDCEDILPLLAPRGVESDTLQVEVDTVD